MVWSLSPRCFRSWTTSWASRRDLVAGADGPDRAAIHGDDQGGLPGVVELLQGRFDRLGDLDASLEAEPAVADEDLPFVASCDDPRAGLGLEVADLEGREPSGRGLGHDQAGERVLAGLLGGGGEAERRVGRPAVDRDQLAELGTALGQGAGLVEGQDVDLREPLQGRAALDQDPPAGEPGRRRQDGGRGGQDQGAGAGHDEHGQGRHHVDRPRVGRAGGPPVEARGVGDREDDGRRDQDGGQEPPGVAVGRPLDRRAVLLGLGQEPDDPAEGGLGPDLVGPDDQAAEAVDRAREGRVALALVDGHRLAGQGRLVDGRPPLDDRAVGGDPLAGPDDDPVADDEGGRLDLDLLAVAEHAGGPGPEVEESLNVAPGPLEGE